MTAVKSSFGTYLKIGNGGSTETFATIAEVRDIEGPELEAETEDVTSHDSPDGWSEHISTILSGGEVSFDLNWIPGHATQSAGAGLVKDFQNRALRNFQLVIPAASAVTWSFAALVTGFKPKLPVKGSLGAEVTLLISGKPTLA